MVNTSEDINIQKEKLHLLLGAGATNLIANTLLAAVLAYMQSAILPLEIAVLWFLSVLTVNSARYCSGMYFSKHPVENPVQVHKRLNIFRVGLVATALVWSVSSFLVLGETVTNYHYEHALFVAYMLAGLSAGATVAYSIDLMSALSFIIFAILPTMVAYFLSGHHTLIAMGVAGFLYVAFISISAKILNQKLIEGVKLRFQAIKSADEIKRLAFYDTLTNLPNRRLLLERLERAFLQNWRTGKRSALLFVDLDHFKQLNDSEGHDMGDMLLMKVAHRLHKNVRASDTVSRFGGDEFVLLLENLSEDYDEAVKETAKLAQQILKCLNQPYQLIDLQYQVTASIGIAMFVKHGSTQKDLLKNADIAMYAAKQSGRNNYCFFNDAMAEAKQIHVDKK